MWKVTGDLGFPWVGTCYLLSAAIVTVPLVLSIIVLCRLGGKDISDLGQPNPVRPTYREREHDNDRNDPGINDIQMKKEERF